MINLAHRSRDPRLIEFGLCHALVVHAVWIFQLRGGAGIGMADCLLLLLPLVVFVWIVLCSFLGAFEAGGRHCPVGVDCLVLGT